MRLLIGVILGTLTIAGCAGRQRHATASNPPHEFAAFDDAAAVSASALVFDPPVAAGLPPLEMARDDRQPSAFVSYDEVQTTYFYLRLDDRQKLANDGRSERRVISETFGISRR